MGMVLLAACSSGSPDARAGNTINYVNYEPQTLNPYLEPEGVAAMFDKLFTRGLTDRGPAGEWVALLAQKVPDPRDGDVSPDLLRVVWKLKPGLKWSDGSPLTSDDLRFTWEVCSNPHNGCAKNQGLVHVTGVDTPDAQTIVLHYATPYFYYKGQFIQGVLPRHGQGIGTPEQFANWEWNRSLQPTSGPFVLGNWRAGQGMTLVRNPFFYEPGKPYLDGMNVTFKNDPQSMLLAVMSGDADLSTWLTIPAPAQLQRAREYGLSMRNGRAPFLNEIQLNLRDPTNVARPHPILGDVAVRQAILMGIDVDQVIANWSIPGFFEAKRITSPADLEPEYACDMPPLQSDPVAARALLDRTGWIMGNDGVRRKQGIRMRLRVGTYTGFGMEPNVVVLQSQLRQLGIDAVVDNTDTQVLYSSWSDDSPLFRGDFDILFYDWARNDIPDLQAAFANYYGTAGIPDARNPAGRNTGGISDPAIDQLIERAAHEVDAAARRSMYCEVADRVQNRLYAQVYTAKYTNWPISQPWLKGWEQYEEFSAFGQGAENWYIDRQMHGAGR